MPAGESENLLSGRMIALLTRGVPLYIREEGKGFPLLLMHGGPWCGPFNLAVVAAIGKRISTDLL